MVGTLASMTSATRAVTEEAVAARAVAHALRTSHREAIRYGGRDPEEVIQTSMMENWHTERTVSFWKATGPGLTAALQTVCDVDEAQASFLVGAALHATILARQDTAPDAILRLAERAACWDAGRRWVADRIT